MPTCFATGAVIALDVRLLLGRRQLRRFARFETDGDDFELLAYIE